MLRDHFYKLLTIEKQELGSKRSRLRLNEDHPIFEGHFPTVPVVPGVCMIQMVKEQLEDSVGRKLQLSKAAGVKFLSVLNPLSNPELFLDIKYVVAQDGSISMDAVISFEETVYFKITNAIYR